MDGQRGYPDSAEPRRYGAGGSYGDDDWGGRGAGYPEQPRAEEGYRAPDPHAYGEQPRYGDPSGGSVGGLSGTRYDTAWSAGVGETRAGEHPAVAPTSGPGHPVSAPGRPAPGFGQSVPGPGQPPPVAGVPGQPVSGAGPAGQPPPGFGQPGPGGDHARHFHTQPMERPAPRRDPAADAVPGSVYRTKRPAVAVAIAVVVLIFELVTLRIFATAVFATPIHTQGAVGGMFLFTGLPLFGYGLYALVTGAAAAGPGGRPWLRTPLAYLPLGLSLLVCAALAAA